MAEHGGGKGGNFLLGLLFGLLSGGLLSLLLAPASGEESRRWVKKTAKDVSDKAKDIPDAVKDEISNPYSKTLSFLEAQRYKLEKHWVALQEQFYAKRREQAKQREEAHEAQWREVESESVAQPTAAAHEDDPTESGV
jgi:gas vesicle protein